VREQAEQRRLSGHKISRASAVIDGATARLSRAGVLIQPAG
jgi:hypothetical protein